MPSSFQPANTDARSAALPNTAGGASCANTGLMARARRQLFRLSLILHTLRHLRARQWVYLFIRRVLPDRYRAPDVATVAEITLPALRVCALSAVPHHSVREGRLCFLNERAHFPLHEPDWIAAGKSRLWRYNLHYFEFLSDPALSDAQRNALIGSWIAGNPVGHGDGWEPYPVSLRIVSWARYFEYLLRNGVPIDASWRRSFYLHCDWLFQHMEFHIDANHLFKNIVALFMGAHLLRDGGDARVRRWHQKSTQWLAIALREQFNNDGGHYERSPMYHLLCLHFCLDVYNALSNSETRDPLRKQLETVIIKAMEFAQALQHGNAQLALFNDSANGIAPDLDTLCRYARAIDDHLSVATTVRCGSTWFANSGYFCWHDERQHLIVSAGSPQPSYQPGHSHADCLSYEYSLDGAPLIVNAGNTCYENNEERRYARSTSAHSTVEIDGRDQSELWSIFRMARRARVKATLAQHTAPGRVVLVAQHDGYARLRSDLVHQREFIAAPKGIEIRDTLLGKGQHRLRLVIHIHPQFSAVMKLPNENTYAIVDKQQRERAHIWIDAGCNGASVAVERTLYFDQFGMQQLRDSLVVTANVTLPCSLRCYIDPAAALH